MMKNTVYGYVRVSSTDQNEDRQMIALSEAGVPNLTVPKIKVKKSGEYVTFSVRDIGFADKIIIYAKKKGGKWKKLGTIEGTEEYYDNAYAKYTRFKARSYVKADGKKYSKYTKVYKIKL